MVAIGSQSVDSTSNMFAGFWSHVHVTQDPMGTPVDYYLGVAQEGVLEISREDSEYLGTTFPQRVELILPQKAGMKFSCRLDEIHKQNLHLLNAELPGEASNYIYPGVACAFEDVFVRLYLRRKRCDGFVMEAVFWKTTGSGTIQLAGGAEVQGTPAEFAALDDSNGDFGGSESAPLGYLYAPDPA